MFKKSGRVTWESQDNDKDSKCTSKRWFKYTNPFPNYKLGLLQLWFSFGEIWVAQLRYRTRNTRCIRLSLAIIIPFFLVYGVLFTTASLLKVFHSQLWSGLLPYQTNITEFYWGLAIVGMILIVVAIYGMYGIYGHRIWSSKVFAVVSFIYGQASMTVSLSWLLLVQIQSSNSFLNKMDWHHKPDSSREENSLEGHLDQTNIKDNPFLIFIVEIVFIQSLIFVIAGMLTAVLLIRDNNKKGFMEL